MPRSRAIDELCGVCVFEPLALVGILLCDDLEDNKDVLLVFASGSLGKSSFVCDIDTVANGLCCTVVSPLHTWVGTFGR